MNRVRQIFAIAIAASLVTGSGLLVFIWLNKPNSAKVAAELAFVPFTMPGEGKFLCDPQFSEYCTGTQYAANTKSDTVAFLACDRMNYTMIRLQAPNISPGDSISLSKSTFALSFGDVLRFHHSLLTKSILKVTTNRNSTGRSYMYFNGGAATQAHGVVTFSRCTQIQYSLDGQELTFELSFSNQQSGTMVIVNQGGYCCLSVTHSNIHDNSASRASIP